ncbi:hypothetical protein CPB86DRAFT_45263 [Serendipita vermifera]|nr:hypothetical protein CPB86DRAFT_45263 [Serendipita vermifera]
MPPKRKSANSTRRNSTAITNDSPPILSDSSLEDIVLSQSPVKSKFFSSTKTNGVASTPNGKGKLTRSSTRTSTKSDQVNGNGKRKRVATSEEDDEQEEDELTRETVKGSKNGSKRPSPTKNQKQVEEVGTPPKGTATRNPSGRIPYVEVPRRVSGLSRTSSVTNVSQSSGTNSRRQSALVSHSPLLPVLH